MVRLICWLSSIMASDSFEVLCGKKLRSERAESGLGGDEDLARALAAPRDVEQSKQHAGRPHAQELVKVARHALAVVDSGDLRMAQGRHVGVQGIGGQSRQCCAWFEEEAHAIQEWRRPHARSSGFSLHSSALGRHQRSAGVRRRKSVDKSEPMHHLLYRHSHRIGLVERAR
jgi:hypothetical protein